MRYEPDEAEVALLVTPKQAEECFSYDSLYVEISTDYKSSKIIEHFTQYPYTNFYNESTQ